MKAVLAVAAALAASACTPTMSLRDGPGADRLRDIAASFCTAQGSADIADLFVPEVADAIHRAANAGQPAPLASASGPCTPGDAAYWGGSRRFVEIRYANGADTLDLWLSGQGLIDDIHFGDGRDSLRRTLGLRANVLPPAGLFD